MNKCKFCGKEQTKPLSLGYCISCYQYFILHNYKTWLPSSYGSISYVGDINSNQYGISVEKLLQNYNNIFGINII